MLDSLLNHKGHAQPHEKSVVERWSELAYRTQRNYERALRQRLTEKFGIEMASEVAEHVTGYIFNFGEFDFPMNSTTELRRASQSELAEACHLQPIEPEVLCHVLIHRGASRRRDLDDFAVHMRNLWLLRMIPVGTLTPESDLLDEKHEPYIDRVARIDISSAEIDRYAEVWASELPADAEIAAPVNDGSPALSDFGADEAAPSERSPNPTADVETPRRDIEY